MWYGPISFFNIVVQSYKSVNPYELVQSVLFQIVAQSNELVNSYELVQSVLFHRVQSYKPVNSYELVQSVLLTPWQAHINLLTRMNWSNRLFFHIIAQSYEHVNPYALVQSVIFHIVVSSHMNLLRLSSPGQSSSIWFQCISRVRIYSFRQNHKQCTS